MRRIVNASVAVVVVNEFLGLRVVDRGRVEEERGPRLKHYETLQGSALSPENTLLPQ